MVTLPTPGQPTAQPHSTLREWSGTLIRLFGLIRLDTRRAGLLWMAVAVGLIGMVPFWFLRDYQLILWLEVSHDLLLAAGLIAPVVAAAATWIMGHERRQGLDEMLRTVPSSPAPRLLARAVAPAVWGTLGFLVPVGYGGILAVRHATWGGPDWATVGAAFAVILAASGIGVLVGTITAHRLAAPIVGMTLAMLIISTGLGLPSIVEGRPMISTSPVPERFSLLSPLTNTWRSVWVGSVPDVNVWQTLWFLGIGVTALTVALLLRHRTALMIGLTTVSVLVTAVSGGTVVQRTTATPWNVYWDTISNYDDSTSPLTCADDVSLVIPEICVHPAFSPWLADIGAEVDQRYGPLAGLPGLPRRAVQVPVLGAEEYPPHIVPFTLESYPNAPVSAAWEIGYTLLLNDCRFADLSVASCDNAWVVVSVIQLWLDLEYGHSPDWLGCLESDQEYQGVCQAAHRLYAMPEAERRAWLEAHFDALLRHELTLEDFP